MSRPQYQGVVGICSQSAAARTVRLTAALSSLCERNHHPGRSDARVAVSFLLSSACGAGPLICFVLVADRTGREKSHLGGPAPAEWAGRRWWISFSGARRGLALKRWGVRTVAFGRERGGTEPKSVVWLVVYFTRREGSVWSCGGGGSVAWGRLRDLRGSTPDGLRGCRYRGVVHHATVSGRVRV